MQSKIFDFFDLSCFHRNNFTWNFSVVTTTTSRSKVLFFFSWLAKLKHIFLNQLHITISHKLILYQLYTFYNTYTAFFFRFSIPQPLFFIGGENVTNRRYTFGSICLTLVILALLLCSIGEFHFTLISTIS